MERKSLGSYMLINVSLGTVHLFWFSCYFNVLTYGGVFFSSFIPGVISLSSYFVSQYK